MISLNITGNIGARYESPPFFPSKIIRNFSNLWYLFVLFFFLFFDIYKDFNGNWIDSISWCPKGYRISLLFWKLNFSSNDEIILFRSACEVKIVSGRGREKATKLWLSVSIARQTWSTATFQDGVKGRGFPSHRGWQSEQSHASRKFNGFDVKIRALNESLAKDWDNFSSEGNSRNESVSFKGQPWNLYARVQRINIS